MPLTLDATWRSTFEAAFNGAAAVYIATPSSAGRLDTDGRMPCDMPVYPPPPPDATSSGKARADLGKLARQAEQDQIACTVQPVHFEILDVIKGQSRTAWTEENAWLALTSQLPTEPPTEGPNPFAFWKVASSDGGVCGPLFARRLSEGSRYLIFVSADRFSGRDGVTAAFLIEGDRPFEQEARKLASRH